MGCTNKCPLTPDPGQLLQQRPKRLILEPISKSFEEDNEAGKLIDGLSAALRIIAPIRDEAPAQRVERHSRS
jgi:hypothetical protein